MPLAALLVPFALGIGLEDLLGLAPVWSAGAAALAGAAWALTPVRIGRALEAAIGSCLGALALGLRLHAPVPAVEPGPVALTLLEAPLANQGDCRMAVWIHGARPGRALLLARGAACALLPTQPVLARVRLERVRPASNPGAGDSRARLARRGIRRIARLEGEALAPIGSEPRGLAAGVERLRRHFADTLDPPQAPTRAGALLRAMAVADVSRLDEPLRRAFADSGTTHLLSVSGTHIVWVFWLTRLAVTWALGRSGRLGWVRRARAAGMLAAAAAGLGYAFLCGLEAPALRSAAMAAAGGIALLGGRTGTGWNALALAALIVLAFDPSQLFEASFQMSFVAVAALLTWQAPPGVIRGLAHASLAAGLATAPLAARLGAPLPAGWLLANALAVPYFGAAVVPPALVAGALGGVMPVLPWLARAAAALGVRGLQWLATPDLLAGPHDRVALAAFAAASLFALRGLWQRRRGLSALSLLAAAISGALAAPADNEPVIAPRIVFFDVGHGDAVLVRAGRHAWLVDAGTHTPDFDAGRSVVLPGLRALGVRRLDALALTHSDLDHVGGAPAVLDGLPVRELWLTRETLGSPALRVLRRSAARRGVRLRIVAAGDRLGPAELALDALWPAADFAPPSTNAGSLVLRVGVSPRCALLGGDAPAAVERALSPALGACDLLKLSHHGSQSSSDPALLDALEPTVAVASAGRRPRSPLPHPTVRARLRAREISLWETRRDGAIAVELARPGPLVLPWLNPRWSD
ncbi:MAG TPA: DNA internalization-related competence protein ComEC/Rec2 [Myxococcota bacterium]|nr:DNA internalization-related competence protein ComEC/Rec2 [Myxococcota bacterium]